MADVYAIVLCFVIYVQTQTSGGLWFKLFELQYQSFDIAVL